MIGTLKKDLKGGECVPLSVETHSEWRTFVHGNQRAMAALPGCKYDQVLALSLANTAARQAGVGEMMFL